jgi:hypothetical protein
MIRAQIFVSVRGRQMVMTDVLFTGDDAFAAARWFECDLYGPARFCRVLRLFREALFRPAQPVGTSELMGFLHEVADEAFIRRWYWTSVEDFIEMLAERSREDGCVPVHQMDLFSWAPPGP